MSKQNNINDVINTIKRNIDKCKAAIENNGEYNGRKASKKDLEYLQDQLEDAIQLKSYMKE